MNFYDIPCEIKRIIFKINRDDAERKSNKKKYDKVLSQIHFLLCMEYIDRNIILSSTNFQTDPAICSMIYNNRVHNLNLG